MYLKSVFRRTLKMSLEKLTEIERLRRIAEIQRDQEIAAFAKSTINTILIDVNIDCIESMFGHLELVELLNVADSNEYLKIGAEMIFSRKYAKKRLWMDLIPDASVPSISIQKSWTKITDMKTCLQTLRCFGHLITNLHVTGDQFLPYGRETEQVFWLLDYINEYCRNDLQEITFEKFSGMTLCQIQLPFLKLKTIRFRYCCVERTLPNFNKLFPAVRKLELLWTDVTGLDDNILDLNSLEINMPITLSECQKVGVKRIIKLNPKMHELKLYFGWDIEYLREICKHVNYVEHLEIGSFFSNPTEPNRDVIHLNGVKRFALHTNGLVPDSNVTFSFDALDQFTFETTCCWNEENIKLISKHSNITKLVMKPINLKCRSFISKDIAMKMAKTLIGLKEICICYKQFSVNEVMYFLNSFELLQKISFKIDKREEFTVLMSRAKHEWTANIDDENRVKMERNA